MTGNGAGNARFPGVPRGPASSLRKSRGARVREGPGLLRSPVGVRAAHVRARGERGRPRARGIHARLLSSGTGPLPRGHGDEAVARHAEEPQAPEAPPAVPRGEREALLQAGPRAARRAPEPRPRPVTVGEVYFTAAQLRRRVGELGAEIARDYEGRDLLLVVPLKGSIVFAADLSRCIRIPHALDF